MADEMKGKYFHPLVDRTVCRYQCKETIEGKVELPLYSSFNLIDGERMLTESLYDTNF